MGDQNHISGIFKLWSHLKLKLSLSFCATNQPLMCGSRQSTLERHLGPKIFINQQNLNQTHAEAKKCPRFTPKLVKQTNQHSTVAAVTA